MARIKTPEEIEHLKEGGKRLARVVKTVSEMVAPGVSTKTLDDEAEKMIRAGGDEPAFLNYQPDGVARPFPATLCISINEEIVHGIPNENERIIEAGDIVSIDCGLVHQGLITDHAVSVVAGAADENTKRLLAATKEGLMAGIAAIKSGGHVGDIGAAIDAVAHKYRYGNIFEFGGHGVGHKVHELPFIMNVGEEGEGEELLPGMVLAIEPMFTEGSDRAKILADDYTVVTRDGSRSAHFEHTIVVTENGAQIITVP